MDEEENKKTVDSKLLKFLKHFALHYVAGVVFVSIILTAFYFVAYFNDSGSVSFTFTDLTWPMIEKYVFPFTAHRITEAFIYVVFISIPALIVLFLFKNCSLKKRLLYHFLIVTFIYSCVGPIIVHFTSP